MKGVMRFIVLFFLARSVAVPATEGLPPEASSSINTVSNSSENAMLCRDYPADSVVYERGLDDDPLKSGDRNAVLKLLPQCEATNAAVQSGPWSDPRTWRNGQLPGIDARVFIPNGVTVEVDALLDQSIIDWIKVAGNLRFHSDRNTGLAVRTLLVASGGLLQIGSVAEPVRADVQARLLFAPRGPRNRRQDPFDLGGGLISLGVVQMIGVRKTAHALTRTPLRPGTDRLDFAEPPTGWQVGDRLLLPGTDAFNDEDEVRTIIGIGEGGKDIKLDNGLSFAHFAPSGISLPIGNLKRNIELRSLVSEPLEARGHVMITHVQTGTVFDGVAFIDLGRTDTRFAHTFPELEPDGLTKTGTDSNTIGRYAVHFHLRSGARSDLAPHVVRNSVVIDSPKYGIVNHGGHLLAEDNVTFRIAGSHFVAENGSEIGAFRRNLAVRSSGSGEAALENRMSIYDFGHGGHGFWLQSSSVEVSDNWAFGHARAGVFSMGLPFREQGKEVLFESKNLASPPSADALGRVKPSDVTFHFARNTVAGSGLGLEIWYHKMESDYHEPSVADGLTVWNTAESAVSLLYTRSVALRHLRLFGSRREGIPGIVSNEFTESIAVQDGEIRNFAVGLRLAERGHDLVRNMIMANAVNFEIPIAMVKGRQIQFDDVSFESGGDTDSVNFALHDVNNVRYGDLALLFAADRIDLTDSHRGNYRLFFPFQRPGAVPLTNQGPEAIQGLTSAEIYRRYAMAPGGVLAPPDAVELPRSNALASPSPLPASPYSIMARGPWDWYPMQTQHFGPPSELSHWEVAQSPDNGGGNALVYASSDPARFMLRRGLLPLEIHPDDVSYGYRVAGVILERVDQQMTLRTLEREFRDLKIGPDGSVRLAFSFPNLAGAEIPFEIALKVTADAVRRGPNIDFWSQRQFCGSCGRNTLKEDAQRFYETGELEPIPRVVAGDCQRWKTSAVVLNPPFHNEVGHAFVALLPGLKEMADRPDSPRQSPFFLCEGDRFVGEPHSTHDSVRRTGLGNFSHWSDRIYFSSSDGSDPNNNGYHYALVRTPGN